MERKPKGWKGPSWTEFLVKYKDNRGLSYRDLARECEMSDASWHAMVTGKGPPNYNRAKQAAAVLKMPEETWLNIIFKDRLLRWAKIEGILRKPPTPAIERFLEFVLTWDPTEEDKKPLSKGDSPIGYIMSPFKKGFGMGFANNYSTLRHEPREQCLENRSDGVRVVDFR